jgi:hypothetical protein
VISPIRSKKQSERRPIELDCFITIEAESSLQRLSDKIANGT